MHNYGDYHRRPGGSVTPGTASLTGRFCLNINAANYRRGVKHIHRDNIECTGEANK